MEGRLSPGLLNALVLLASVMEKTVSRAEGRRPVPALFVFGDSILDVGNNNYLPRSMAKVNFPPNGIDFPGGKPTGRFSNGYNIADYLAKQYGFKRSPPAFLSLTEWQLKRSICKGINFASGGSGILNSTGISLGEVIPMDVQLDNFRSSLEGFTARRCSMVRRTLLSKSVFLLSAGSNDLFGLYASNTSQTREFITTLASKYGRQLRTLYGLGARRFGILGISLIGCAPSLRRLSPSGECIAALDDYALQFNVALRKVLASKFNSKHGGMKYSVGDGINVGKKIADNALAYGDYPYQNMHACGQVSSYMLCQPVCPWGSTAQAAVSGLKETKSACCGSGKFNGESACTPNATLCSNRGEYLFWDWFHATAATAKLQARLLYSGPPTLAYPINFGELAED